VLGYKRLQQTDIDKYYSTQAHQNQLELNLTTQQEFLRVLEKTSKFETAARSEPDEKSATTIEIPAVPPPADKSNNRSSHRPSGNKGE